jgi:hypothetical protein
MMPALNARIECLDDNCNDTVLGFLSNYSFIRM